MQSLSWALDGAESCIFKNKTGNSFLERTRAEMSDFFSNYLPVDCGVGNQLVKLLLDGKLEGTGLVPLLSILASESSLSRAHLQEHD